MCALKLKLNINRALARLHLRLVHFRMEIELPDLPAKWAPFAAATFIYIYIYILSLSLFLSISVDKHI